MSTDPRIDGYASALFEVARAEGTLDEVEDELFRFARAFESNEQLRSTLTDELIPIERRQAVVESLLGGKASHTTTQLVSMVVGSGRGRDLPAIVDRLVARAASSKDAAVAEVRSAVALSDEVIPIDRRQAVVESLLGGTASATTTQLVSMVVGSGRGRDLPAIVDRLVARAASSKDATVAEVRSAVALSDDQRDRLKAALANATGRNVNLKVVVDPSVIGGLVATVGDTVIDGTLRTRLDQLKARL